MNERKTIDSISYPTSKDVSFHLNTGENITFTNFFEALEYLKSPFIDYSKKHPKVNAQIFSKRGKEYIPQYATSLSSGCDLRAMLDIDIVIEPGARALIPTGLKVNIPPGFELQIRPKSGLALKDGITVLNTPGTVDADYSNFIGVILINHNNQPVKITDGMRIAQAVLCPIYQMAFTEVEESIIDNTDKKSERKGGFGSTGI